MIYYLYIIKAFQYNKKGNYNVYYKWLIIKHANLIIDCYSL